MAVSKNGKILYRKENADGFSHSVSLGTFVDEAIRQVENQLDAVAVSEGPGSYTGLRIGVSLTKGLCYGLKIPMIAVPTLKILTAGLLSKVDFQNKNMKFCPMIDARRMEVYAAVYDEFLHEVEPTQSHIVDENFLENYLAESPVVFFGDGSGKCKKTIQSTHAIFVDDIYPSASAMVQLAEESFLQKQFVDIAYFEPFYLKEFQATVPKNLLKIV
ncbi:tRNA (adenosine(37)-N6)-threonylcarbamoyltransferase complex dimerization subunit type 1 TsaB [Bacteroidia bacterium]|nr:tRNA (adenosine(37)-N6)-threonylcarbamoyltransferase complex dimerization subunit type 1 TsaB [Bacteroidia bacterium]